MSGIPCSRIRRRSRAETINELYSATSWLTNPKRLQLTNRLNLVG